MKRTRPATKKELETMLLQIEKGDTISIFNAQKALYIQVDSQKLLDVIEKFLDDKLALEILDDW